MKSHNQGACAARTRRTRTLPAASGALAFVAVVACLFAAARGEAQTMNAQANASTVVGMWQATAPNGLRVATLTIVPDGEGFAGAFVGYDYDRATSFDKPLEGAPPKVAVRSGSLLVAPKLDGNTFTFRVQIRHPSPPPNRPAGYEISGEVTLAGSDAAELKLSAPHKGGPLVLKLSRE